MPQAEITLEYNGLIYDLFLADGVKSVQESSAEESTFNARFARGKKRYGEDPLLTLAEFRDWTGGRGGVNFEDDATAFFDGLAWTLSPGTAIPPPRWKIATGLRTENRHLPGDMSWKALVNTERYVSIAFSAVSAYSAGHIWLYVKRVGAPGTLTVDLCANSNGIPGTISKSVTKTISDITDYIDVFEDFAHATPLAMSSSGIYHIVVSGAEKDSGDNHWEVGVDRVSAGSKSSSNTLSWADQNYKLYYRVTGAHVSNKFVFQNYSTGVYATTRPASGASSFYLFDNSSAFSAAGGTTGLGIVTGRPIMSNGKMYFPQGSAAHVRYWDGSTTWTDDGTNHATLLLNYQDSTGPQVAKSLGSLVGIAPATTGALTFGTDIACGDTTYGITNLIMHTNKLYVLKEDQIGIISGGAYALQESNYKYTPSPRNGAAACSWNGLLYTSWLNTFMEIYGVTANDVGQAWRGQAPGGNRAGYVSSILGINAWRFYAIDAGTSGYSSVCVYNGMTHHEIYRAPFGHRIRDLWWQHVDGGHSKLFIDIDYDVVYLEFPIDVAKPTNDRTHNYAHSFYITSPTFDDGAARLSKYIKAITISGTNCGEREDSYVYFEIDYQLDNDVGEEGADHWHRLGKVFTSPEGTLMVNAGNVKCNRIRVRGYTDNALIPPQLDAITIDGFTRTPARTVWNLRVKTGSRGAQKKEASNLLKFLQEASTAADDILVTSTIPELNGRHVIITRPRVQRDILVKLSDSWSGIINMSLMDMSE
jgi:hypothetical protein